MNGISDLAYNVETAEIVLKKELIETSMLIVGIIVVIWVAFIGIADNAFIVMALSVNAAVFAAMFMAYRNIDGANLKVLGATASGLLITVIIGLSRLLNLEILALIKMPLEFILISLGFGIVILMLMLAKLYISWSIFRTVKKQQQNTAGAKG